jgi:hypothetical protein
MVGIELSAAHKLGEGSDRFGSELTLCSLPSPILTAVNMRLGPSFLRAFDFLVAYEPLFAGIFILFPAHKVANVRKEKERLTADNKEEQRRIVPTFLFSVMLLFVKALGS